MEAEKVREKEPSAKKSDTYELVYSWFGDKRKEASEGKVVIRGKDLPWEQARQGLLKFYSLPMIGDAAYRNTLVFVHDIRQHSGKHRHQGGLVIYVIEGKGYTTVDAERVEWEAGDLILLPIKPRGVEHQHFNREHGKPCKWLAFVYQPFSDSMGNEFEQKEVSPDWKQS